MDIYSVLKKEILSGVIPFGERIFEEQLAERFNTSRTPIREAIRSLAGDSLVVYSKNKGATVRTYTIEDVRNNYNLRALLEGYATFLAASNPDKGQLDTLSELIVESEKALLAIKEEQKSEHIYRLVDVNHMFHDTIANMSGNQEIPKLLKNITTLPIMFHGFKFFKYPEVVQSIGQHKNIEKAIREGDPQLARSTMEVHILNRRDNVLQSFHKLNHENEE